MANFMTFGTTIKSANSTSVRTLAPWQIHEVIFKGVKFDTLKNSKDEANPYKVMKIRFENENGYFEKLVFSLKEEDGERRKNSGGKEMLSNYENFQFLVLHLIEKMVPEKKEAFLKAAAQVDILKNFDTFVALLNKVLTPAVDKPINIKLIGNKEGKPTLPYFAAINKEGEAFFSNNFLDKDANKLFFTDYELSSEQKIKANTPKPTNMATMEEVSTTVGEESAEDLDFDIIEE